MRSDMNKVMLESPRVGGRAKFKAGRAPRDLDALPTRQSMRRPYVENFGCQAKEFRGHYTPMRRYLEAQVGRPWNRVYSEICQTFRSNKQTAQWLGDVEHFVSIRDIFLMEDGRVMHSSHYGMFEVNGLYVHPQTGLLCKVDTTGRRAKRAEQRAQAEQALLERRRVISDSLQLLKLDNVWFAVELAPIVPPLLESYTVKDLNGTPRTVEYVRHSTACKDIITQTQHLKVPQHCWENAAGQKLYGRNDVYAKAKRQLSKKELKHYGLPH